MKSKLNFLKKFFPFASLFSVERKMKPSSRARLDVSKPVSLRQRFDQALALVLIVATFFGTIPVPVYALPSDGVIVGGAGAISQGGSGMTIDQASDKMIINWKGFSISAQEFVNFAQPGAGSIALNRVLGGDMSSILGALNANGRIILLNPNGILFGQGAQVNVGGLIASTLNLSNENFLAGNYAFSGDSSAGSVTNLGVIRANDGGHVFLIAPQVANEGTIQADGGQVGLIGGSEVYLTEDLNGHVAVAVTVPEGETVNSGQILGSEVDIWGKAVRQAGLVQATGATRDAYGRVTLVGSESTTLESGSKTSAAGGSVTVKSGGDALAQAGSLVDVSPNDLVASAGSVVIEGNRVDLAGTVQANGPDGRVRVASSGATVMEGTSRIEAAGGEVRINQPNADGSFGGPDNSTNMLDGSVITTLGGAANGFVEVSGKVLDVNAGTIQAGHILFDPLNIDFRTGVADSNVTGFTPPGDQTEAFADDAGLTSVFSLDNGGRVLLGVGAGTTIEFQATNDITVVNAFTVATVTGDANVNVVFRAGNDITFTAAMTLDGTGTFTAFAADTITINAAVTGATGAFAMTADALAGDTGGSGNANNEVGVFSFGPGGRVETTSGDITLTQNANTDVIFTDVRATAAGGDIALSAEGVIHTNRITSTGGTISITSTGADVQFEDSGLATDIDTGGGTLTVTGLSGITQDPSTNIATGAGRIFFTTDSNADGTGSLSITGGDTITTTANFTAITTGTVSIAGTINLGGAGADAFIGASNVAGEIEVGLATDGALRLQAGDLANITGIDNLIIGTFTVGDGAAVNNTHTGNIQSGSGDLVATDTLLRNSGAGNIIDDGSNGTTFTANNIEFNAGSGIGTSANPLTIDSSSDNVTLVSGGAAAAGDIFARENGGNLLFSRLTAVGITGTAGLTTAGGSVQIITLINDDVVGNAISQDVGGGVVLSDHLVLEADNMAITNGLSVGANNITLRVFSADRNITIGTEVAGTLSLTAAEIANINTATTDLTIGSTTGGGINFTASVDFLASDTLLIAGDAFAITNAAAFIATADGGGGNIAFSADNDGANNAIGTVANPILTRAANIASIQRSATRGDTFITEDAGGGAVAVNTITITSGRTDTIITGASSTNGDIFIRTNNGALTITSAVNAGGAGRDVILDSNGVGDVAINANVTASDDLQIDAFDAITFTALPTAIVITGDTLGLTAADGIGTLAAPINTAVATVAASNTTTANGVFIRESNGLIIGTSIDIDATDGIAAVAGIAGGQTGNIRVATLDGNMTVANNITASGGAGETILLTVTNNGDNDSFTLNAATTITDAQGDIVITADQVILTATGVIDTTAAATGDVRIQPFNGAGTVIVVGSAAADSATNLELNDGEVNLININAGDVIIIGNRTATIVSATYAGDTANTVLTGTISVDASNITLDADSNRMVLETTNATATAITDGTVGLTGGTIIDPSVIAFDAVGGIDVTINSLAATTMAAISRTSGDIIIDQNEAADGTVVTVG
ncbi:MAG: filamentous hemagglutinin N-terminal domain-containing protein, partial [Planctomycetes bacterium]|nr:filamentous hemagglutinin N-terminal domain-containing protein [Planctomycetota bacterium]